MMLNSLKATRRCKNYLAILCPILNRWNVKSLSTTTWTKQDGLYDFAIVGGGIVGLATARELILRYPDMKFVLLEKESCLAMHQSSHNSGVIHSGIYYTPGTLKAKLCVKGLDMTYSYCKSKGIPFKKCGKLIVAVNDGEISRLHNLFERGKENGAKDLKLLSKHEIKTIEPNCEGVLAIHSPHTGIVDWGEVARSYGKEFQNNGGEVILNFEVAKFTGNGHQQYPVKITGKQGDEVFSRYAVTCGGLYSDRLAKLSGCNREPRVVPFRGEYLKLSPENGKHLVRGNIYPVPDPTLPFLGVHFTPRMDGSVLLGPNAVLAFAREGYRISDVNIRDLMESVTFRGLRRLAMKHWKFGASEFYHGLNRRAQVERLQKYVPSLRHEDVTRGPTGVRAQALDVDGNLVEDFILDQGEGELSKRLLHVRNAPSPAATSSLPIAEMIADQVEARFNLTKQN
ncbi:L-2-hydroxyglutarate dehydrogenase, mitochondrial-like isoform X2 [Dendronephthya gigantea]|uniref:L-2-hydroxyglutarate dehydrogenase, mitochondrial-like isoform X2 n=1 Tax=Dendronephthya gigantea TaxID=151771 RepID=UPI00106D1355|nr:L-2-hydroxyglutarate dehydrogenase, mitochondrial-like isoform X2 [Dendronephthya gigantea]